MENRGFIFWKNNWKTIFVKHPLFWLFFLGLVLRLFASVQIYSGDVNNHIGWAKDALAAGLSGIYGRNFEKYGVMTPTYPPIPVLFFTFFYWLYKVIFDLCWNLNLKFSFFPSRLIWFLQDQDTLPAFLKIPAILADLGIAYFVYRFAQKILEKKSKKIPLFLAGLVLFNPAFFYNSASWGQIEAVPLFFLLASLYCLFYYHYRLSAIIFALAFLTKQTVIIFAPLYGFIYFKKYGLKKSLKGLAIFLLIFIILFLPFYSEGNLLTFPFLTYWNKIQSGSGSDYVTDHAFNFWALISGLGKIPDRQPFLLGISYSSCGYFLFGVMLLVIFGRLFKKGVGLREYVLAAALIPFASFLFLTRMHERYLEPVLPFLLLSVLFNKSNFWAFIFLSFFYSVNLYHNWWFGGNAGFKLFLSRIEVINGLILLVIGVFILLLVQYYQEENK